METSEYLRLVDETLKALYKRLDRAGIDDADILLSDGKLVVEFEDGITYIVNRQGGSQQIWLAEPGMGWKFNYKDGEWRCDKRGTELFAAVCQALQAKLGSQFDL